MCSKTQKKLCDKQDCKICFERSFASHHRAEFWSDKNKEKPRDICRSSAKKFLFDCDKCSHTFEKRLDGIAQQSGWCPYCCNQKLCENEYCKMCFNNSFISHHKAKFWSDKNIKSPREVFKNSNKKFWFKCQECSHDFDIALNSINGRLSWCSYCSKPPKRLCDDENCNHCFDNSFASHPKAEFWSDKNKEKPRNVFKGSENKFWFRCQECGHDFETKLYCILDNKWCKYCGHNLLCDDMECSFCFDNSFASHPKAEFWSDKNIKSPREIFKSCNDKFWFDCHKCKYCFCSSPNKITEKKNPTWCPKCRDSKAEINTENILKKLNIPFSSQKTFSGLKFKGNLKYDIFFELEGKLCVIELDGEQHFDKESYYNKKKNFEDSVKRDMLKNIFCCQKKICLLRIAYIHFDNIENLINKFIAIVKRDDKTKYMFSSRKLYKNHIEESRKFRSNNKKELD